MMPPAPGSHGTLLFDGKCGMCSATEGRWRAWLQRHGFQTGFLQDDALANSLPATLRHNPRGLLLLTPTGQTLVGVDALAEFGMVVKFCLKTRPLRQWEIKRELLRRIKKRFDELGIEIPYPHHTLYMRNQEDIPTDALRPLVRKAA